MSADLRRRAGEAADDRGGRPDRNGGRTDVRHWIEGLAHDLRDAGRSLRRTPGFTIIAVLTLALGIGANAAVFSLVDASLFRPLPFDDADRIVTLYQTRAESDGAPRPARWAYPEFEAIRSSLTTVSHLAAYWADGANLAGAGDPVRVGVEMVSAPYFHALGLRPALGRTFRSQQDAEAGAHPVAILGHALWQRRFDASPNAVGRTIRLNDVSLTVVGVAPAGFRGLTGDAEVWIPQTMAPAVVYPGTLTTMQHFLTVVGRLRPEVSLEQARAEVAVTGTAAADAARAGTDADVEGAWATTLTTLERARRDPSTLRARFVLAGAVSFVLLIAVVNLSGLLLARSIGRARETAVRSALGAGRLRLVRRVLVESGLIGLLGGAAGALLAVWGVRTLVSLAPARLAGSGPAFADLTAFATPRVDARVIGFAAVVAIAAGLLAGVVPALRAARGDLVPALRSGSRGNAVGTGSIRRPTVLSLATMAQVALALVLLVGATHLLQGFQRLRTFDPGFDADGLASFRISPPTRQYGGDAAAPLLERVLGRVEAVPGVRSATVSFCLPFTRCSSTNLHIDGRPDREEPPLVGRHYVGPDHFRTVGIPLLRGRSLTAEDRAGRRRVAVINETAARRFWPDEDPIGKRVRFTSGGGFASPDSLTTIVGIVGDVQYGPPGEEIGPDFYTSYLQFTWPETFVTVRAEGDPIALVPSLRRAVEDVAPSVPIHDVGTLRDRRGAALAGERFATVALAVFAGLGLLLASLGVYGIMAYSVARRRREVGIRLALGATPETILRLVIGHGAALAGVGLGIGTLISLGVAPTLSALVADAGSADPRVFAVVVPTLLLVALGACYLPARAAAGIDPSKTLSEE